MFNNLNKKFQIFQQFAAIQKLYTWTSPDLVII